MSEMKIQETKVNGIEPVEIKQGTPGMVQDSNVTLVSQKNVSRESEKLRENFRFFGPVTFLYACFYAFCMYRNGSGITFPFFMVGSLLFLCCS